MRYKFSLVHQAYCLALFLLFSGVANGLASQQVQALQLLYCVRIGNSYPSVTTRKPMYFYYYIGSPPSWYEAFPFLQELKPNIQNYGQIHDYVPYGNFGVDGNGYVKYPYFYRESGSLNAGTVPDDWTQQDIDEINSSYNSLSESQKAALPGTFVAGHAHSADTSTKFFQFNKATVGTPAYSGGVYTYNENGDVVVSFPDNTGYISGYKPQPDGTYTPVYYMLENNTVTEYTEITPPAYDSLTFDTETGNYSLAIPNYNKQLDKIINKLDTISLDGVNFSPQVTVNPTVTVPPPDVTVNVQGSDVSDLEESLFEIGNTLVANDHALNLQTNDLQLSSDELLDVDALRSWQVDIPLLGNAVDFGLNSLIGKIPNIGTEYVWLDYTIAGSRRNSKASNSNPLNGYHIRIDLTSYQQTLLAVRGWLILFEALYFSLLVYRNVREALKV